VILTLPITILVEGLVVAGYARWHSKPLIPLLLTSLLANILTQSLLWLILNLSPLGYLVTLLLAETGIWLFETVFLFLIRANKLTFRQSLVLSLAMNLTSAFIGWFLPV
jgi:hypothetical protein